MLITASVKLLPQNLISGTSLLLLKQSWSFPQIWSERFVILKFPLRRLDVYNNGI